MKKNVNQMTDEAKCPVLHGVGSTPASNNKWWPNQLTTAALIHHSEKSDPFGPDFDYVAEFKTPESSKQPLLQKPVGQRYCLGS